MYSDEQVAEFKRRVIEGVTMGKSLRKVCDQKDMPSRELIRLWVAKDPEFFGQYTRAREARAEARADYIDEIADEVKEGKLDPNAARVLIDAQKWQAGKEAPKRYGEKTLHTGADGESPVAMVITWQTAESSAS